MDEYLRDIHTIIFKEWILKQNTHHCIVKHNQENDVITIENEYGKAEILFNMMNIIELTVLNKMSNNYDFYLHFQLSSLKHAIELYEEMMKCLNELVNESKTKILFVCSGGMTTSYFAQKLNEAAELLDLDIEASAVAYYQLYETGEQYDVVLLAPQISYLHATVQGVLKNPVVLKIPPTVFAKYDVKKIIELVDESIKNKKEKDVSLSNPLIPQLGYEKKVLILSIYRNRKRVHIAYRLYNRDKIVLDNEVIKYTIALEDLYDVLDTITSMHANIDVIGIALPGIIRHGFVTSSIVYGIEYINIEETLQNRYNIKIVLGNDVNAGAVGYYYTQMKYQSLSLMFQPVGRYAGVGNIANGQLIEGANHLAGEVQFLPLRLSEDKIKLSQTPEGTLDLVSKMLSTIICILNPEAIIIYSDLITDIEDLKRDVKKYLPEEYIPDMIKIDNIQEYIILGQYHLSL